MSSGSAAPLLEQAGWRRGNMGTARQQPVCETKDGDNLENEKTEEELKRLEEENEKLRQEIERVRNLSVKERLYDKVHVSVRTLDIFIGVMIVFGIIVVILGMR